MKPPLAGFFFTFSPEGECVMRKFSSLSVLFGGKKSSKSSKQQQNRNNRRLGVESLESREMLAGSPIVVVPPPVTNGVNIATTVAEQSVPKLDLVPGVQNAVVEKYFITTAKGSYVALADMVFAPLGAESAGSGNFSLVQLDGKSQKFIGSCQTDWTTGITVATTWQPVWVSSAGITVELVLNNSGWFSGGTLGFGLAQADFMDVHGTSVNTASVKITGGKARDAHDRKDGSANQPVLGLGDKLRGPCRPAGRASAEFLRQRRRQQRHLAERFVRGFG